MEEVIKVFNFLIQAHFEKDEKIRFLQSKLAELDKRIMDLTNAPEKTAA